MTAEIWKTKINAPECTEALLSAHTGPCDWGCNFGFHMSTKINSWVCALRRSNKLVFSFSAIFTGFLIEILENQLNGKQMVHLLPSVSNFTKNSLWYKLKTREIFNYPDGHLFKMLLWRLSSILQWSSSLPSWNKYWESSMQKVLRVPTRKNGRASQQL